MDPRINTNEALVLQGYTVLQVKGSERSQACHHIYLRQHTTPVINADWPEGKTLVVYNVPPFCREDNIRFLFKECGEIVRVHLQSKPSSLPLKKSNYSTHRPTKLVQVAYVVFKKSNAIKNASKWTYSQGRYFSDKNVSLVSGLRGYCEEYRQQLIDVVAVEKEAEAYMADYYKKKEEEVKNVKNMEGVPDEEGFIKVTRHGKNRGGRRTEETEKKGHEHLRSRKKKNELRDFYTFQFRETKKKHIADLQAKFEEDKKRVKEMRMGRKFKPY